MATEKKPNAHEGHRQRIKERLLQEGIDHFQPHEVLEVLLFYALPYKDTNPLAHRLIESFGSLNQVLEADYSDLISQGGLTPHTAQLIVLAGQIARRYQKEQGFIGELLYDTATLGKHIIPFFSGEKNESVVLVSMDNKRKYLNSTRIFKGSVNSAQFSFRLAIQQALRDNATAVVIAHNHPNGLAIPSQADLEVTRQFVAALRLVDIRLVDHLVVADNDYVSMADTKEWAPIFEG